VTETSPPTGYGASDEGTLQVTAVAGNCSSAGLNSVTFTNPPLFDITAAFRTNSNNGLVLDSIVCTIVGVDDSGLDGTPVTGWDASNTNVDIEFVPDGGVGNIMTLNCVIKVDP
jgi:hypothetical protein